MKPWEGVIFGILIGALFFSCQEKKEPKLSGFALDPAQIVLQLNKVEARWEILQKDNPPQADTINFRMDLAEARKALAEKNYTLASSKIQQAENWLNQAGMRYYLKHLEDLKSGRLQEDPKELWNRAEEFWAKEVEFFLSGKREFAELYAQAGYEEAELAVTSALRSELSTLEKTQYCLKLAEREAQVGGRGSPEKWKKEAKMLIEKQIENLTDQIRWCLSGTLQGCEPVTIRENRENYLKAKGLLEKNWEEIQELVTFGNQFFPNSFQLPNLAGWIQTWNNTHEKFFVSRQSPLSDSEFQDFEIRKAQEREKEKELVAKYNQFYCQDGEELVKFGLSLERTEVKFEAQKLVFRFRLSNLKSEPIFKPRVRLCGGVVSEEIDLGYERYPGNYQSSFSVPVIGMEIEDSNSEQYKIPGFWVLLIFADAQGKIYRARANF